MAKAQDVSVRQVGPKGAKKAIRHAIKMRRPTFLWGPPGIGKSDLVKQIGDEAGREVIDVRLALWEPTDIKGIPYYNAEVVGYVGFAKQDLYDFDPKSASKAFATPRSWVFVSDLLSDDDCDNDTLTALIAGAIGDGLASKFMAHRKIAGKLPKAGDILDGKVKDLQIKEVSAMYSLTVSLCYELKDRAEKKAKAWDDMADCFFRYMMDNFPTELVVMGAKTALTNYDLPLDATKMKSFDEFHKRFGKYVLSAMEN